MISAEDYAAEFAIDLHTHDLTSPRSLQADDGQIGASSFGCREEMRRVLTRTERTDSPNKLAALIGSACDERFKQARLLARPDLILDAELTVTLPNGYDFPVHPDEIDRTEPSVTDYKTKAGLSAVRKGYVDDAYRFQRHLQYLASFQAGLVPEHGTVRNIFIDRSGKDPNPHVEQEPFSMDVIGEATEWLNDVLYAKAHDEEASKDRPREWCRDYCQFYSGCRGPEIIPERITDPGVARMIAEYHQAVETEKQAHALRSELRDILAGTSGKTADHILTSVWTNTQHGGHWRLHAEAR